MTGTPPATEEEEEEGGEAAGTGEETLRKGREKSFLLFCSFKFLVLPISRCFR